MTSKEFKTNFPELNDNQFKQLHRLIADKVIGKDEVTAGGMGAYVTEAQARRNQLRAEQRQALAELMGVDTV